MTRHGDSRENSESARAHRPRRLRRTGVIRVSVEEARPALAESLISIARAGGRMIFTYGGLDYADWWRRRHGIGG